LTRRLQTQRDRARREPGARAPRPTRFASVPTEDPAGAAMLGRGQRENYASAANLIKRQALFDFPDPERSSGSPVLEHVGWTGNERVLDAGCGNGIWIRALAERGVRSVVGLDLSLGMLEDTRMLGVRAPLVAGDIQSLPFPDESFDVVLCFWMLYHVPNHQRALEECRRVLRPGGQLLATANAAASQRPFDEVLATALATVTGRSQDRWLPLPNFSAENGASILRMVFPAVEERRSVAAFAVPSAEPVLAAMESVRGPVELVLGEAVDWDAAEEVARSLIEEVIARDGVFRTSNASVSFLATK
jgi:SAM-dependent methyltransferase